MNHLQTLAIALACASALPTLLHGQWDEKLLQRHYGGKLGKDPLHVKWAPQGPEAHLLGYQQGQIVMTVVDTSLQKGDDMNVVFFRTRNTYNEGVFHADPSGNIDQLGAAVYGYDVNSTTGELKLHHFVKFLVEQSSIEHTGKARLLEAFDGAPVFVITSEMIDLGIMEGQEQHERSDHFFSIPDLKPILTIQTKGLDDDARDVQREWRILRSESDWKEFPDIEVKTMRVGDRAWTTTMQVFNEAQHTYVEKATSPVPSRPVAAPARKN